MKVLIAYAGTYGSTEKCAVQLSQLLNAETVTVNLAQQGNPKAADYDLVILGSSIRFGQIDRHVKAFVQNQEQDIKACALFLTAAYEQNAEEYFRENYPLALLQKAVRKDCFGGDYSGVKGLDRWILRLVAKKASPRIFYERIVAFAQAFNLQTQVV